MTDLFDSDPMVWDDAAMEAIIEHNRKYRVELQTEKVKKVKPAAIPKEDLKGIGGAGLLGKLGLG